MKIQKFVTAIIFVITCSTSYSQITFSFNSFDRGEYLAVNFGYSLLRSEPDSNAAILDTIFDKYQNLSFIVIKDNTTNDYVNVKVISSEWQNGKHDPNTEIYTLPGTIDNGKLGWIHKEELRKHPVPDDFLMSTYADNEEFLQEIIENADWHSLNNNKKYPMYKSQHAHSYLLLGKNYYETDSLKKSVYYLTKSIQIFEKKTPYMLRALSKMKLEDYQGAINDCSKGLLLEKNPPKLGLYDVSYITSFDMEYDIVDFSGVRGYCNLMLKNYASAISDLNTAIKNDDTNAQLFYFRAISKFNSGLKQAACLDFSRAGELGYEEAYEAIKSNCN